VLRVLFVPAVLMVSTIRYRSLKTLNLSSPMSPKVLLVVAAAIALFVSSPDVVLLVLAYGYLVSPIIEWLVTKAFRPHPAPEPAALAAHGEATDSPAAADATGHER